MVILNVGFRETNCKELFMLEFKMYVGYRTYLFFNGNKKNNNKKSIGNIERLKLSRIILVISKTVFCHKYLMISYKHLKWRQYYLIKDDRYTSAPTSYD